MKKKSSKWLFNRGFRDGKSRGADQQYVGEPCYLRGFASGFASVEAIYVQGLNESERKWYNRGEEDAKCGFFCDQHSEPYMEGLVAGYLEWQIFINDAEDHVLNDPPRIVPAPDRTEVFAPLILAERDQQRVSRQICCEEAHIPFARPDLSDVEGDTDFEAVEFPD